MSTPIYNTIKINKPYILSPAWLFDFSSLFNNRPTATDISVSFLNTSQTLCSGFDILIIDQMLNNCHHEAQDYPQFTQQRLPKHQHATKTNAVLVDKTRFEILCTFSVYRGPQTLFLTSPFRSPFVKTTDPYTYAVRVELAD